MARCLLSIKQRVLLDANSVCPFREIAGDYLFVENKGNKLLLLTRSLATDLDIFPPDHADL